MHKTTPTAHAVTASINLCSSAYELVSKWAYETPEATAISDSSHVLTYKRLVEAIDELALHMTDRNVRAGDRVMIVAENNVAAVTAILSSQKIGAWPAIANARLPRHELAALRKLVTPRLTLFATDASEVCIQLSQQEETVSINSLLSGPLSFSVPDIHSESASQDVTSESVGLLIFTSGTTGIPKAVMHSNRRLVLLGETLRQSRQVTAQDCYNGVAPLAHIMGIANLMSVLAAGASLRLMPRLELPSLAKAIAMGEISHLSFVPTVYARLINYIEQHQIDVSMHQLRYISCGGAPLDHTLQDRIQSAFGMPLVNGYGMTECAPGTRTPADCYSPTGCIGFAEPGVRVRIVSEHETDLPVGAIGEIWMHSPAAMLGYYNNLEETTKTLKEGGWIATGDLGQFLEDGSVIVVGRKKEMIIRSGFNVYPAEVEQAINSIQCVAASAVVGRKLPDGDEQIIAFVELRPQQYATEKQLQDYLKKQLAAYKCPQKIMLLDQLPQGSSGKIWKAELAKLATQLPIEPPVKNTKEGQAPSYISPPAWFIEAVNKKTHSHFIESQGTKIHYRSWNAHDNHKPALLFVHGYKANSHWWDFIAPFFMEQFRVYAMDFSGMGRSEYRTTYSTQSFSEDIVAVLEQGTGPATVIGHSYGGLRTLRVCADRADLINHAIILDSRVRFVDENIQNNSPKIPPGYGQLRHYPDYASLRKRYRVLPNQPNLLDSAFEHIAFHSIKHESLGWTWASDPALPFILIEADGETLLRSIKLPVDYVYGDLSIVVEKWRADRIATTLGAGKAAIAIAQSHHHMMLDQPLTLVSVLRTLLTKAKT